MVLEQPEILKAVQGCKTRSNHELNRKKHLNITKYSIMHVPKTIALAVIASFTKVILSPKKR
ncbi:MAG: hypothetical protein DRR19_31140 [Candidatus Parabeggiatoa sp. nov. 1]|nr:MAG: hypothetical protein DRR19_31140 [Gammaproteobacteria bacterium]